MSWAKFDDRFPNHPKVLALSDSEFRLHVTAICYCCDQLTDGVLPECVPSSLPRAPRAGRLLNAIASLERIGLWDRIDSGWEVHDFLDWNPSADRVKAKKAARAAAGRVGGLAKAKQLASKTPSNCQNDRTGLLRTCSKQTSAPSPSPSPSLVDIQDQAAVVTGGGPGEPCSASPAQPSPTPTTSAKPVMIPEDWCPSNEQLAALATKHGVTKERVGREVPEFRWYWRSGAGQGKRRSLRGWSQAFGVRVDDQAKRGVLFAEADERLLPTRPRDSRVRGPTPLLEQLKADHARQLAEEKIT